MRCDAVALNLSARMRHEAACGPLPQPLLIIRLLLSTNSCRPASPHEELEQKKFIISSVLIYLISLAAAELKMCGSDDELHLFRFRPGLNLLAGVRHDVYPAAVFSDYELS